MALREPRVKIEAITVVAGNCPLATCLRNALITVEKANTYTPPVYSGLAKPMFRDLFTSEFVHGNDGMGNMNLPEPGLKPQKQHAVDALIETARAFDGELEIIALGPLTNLAIALLREPELVNLIKHLYIMGGAGLGPGNITPTAEFNFFVDAEAANLVIASNLAKTVVGWDVSTSETFFDSDDIDRLSSSSDLGAFSARCNASLRDFNKRWGKDGFDLPDPTAVAAALYPDMIETFSAYSYVEYRSEQAYGQYVIDELGLLQKPHNVVVCRHIEALPFKKSVFTLLEGV